MSSPVSGIYQITHRETGRCYIGSSNNIARRWDLHHRQLRRNHHHSRFLQRMWNKYGADAFDWQILEVVEDLNSLLIREQAYLDECKPAFNTARIAGSSRGVKASPELRAYLSAAQKRRNANTPMTERQLAALRTGIIVQMQRAQERGYRFTEEQRQQFSELLKQRYKTTPPTEKQLAILRMGTIAQRQRQQETGGPYFSETARKNIGAAAKQAWARNHDAHAEALREAGKRRVEETGMYRTPEWQANWEAGQKRRWERYRAEKEAAKQIIQHPLFPDDEAVS